MAHTPPTPCLEPSLIWTCDPTFGIVHSSGCNICLAYSRHVASDSQLGAETLSLHLAIKKRDCKNPIRYLDGVAEGMRLQSQEFGDRTADILEKYRSERDDVLEALNVRSAQLSAVQQELLEVKEQVKGLQALFDDAFHSSAQTAFEPSRVEVPKPPTPDYSNEQNVQVGREERLKSPLRITSHLPTPPASPPPQSSTLPPPSPGRKIPTHSSETIILEDNSPPDVLPLPDSPPAPESDLTSEPPPLAGPPSILQDLLVLMSQARKGNNQARMTVEFIHTTALSTPEVDRTRLQQLILLEWKPRQSPLPAVPSSAAHLLSQSSTGSGTLDVFVDSSGWGIGFVLNGRWMAWKLRPDWNVDGRDNNWAEMVAVELGLLVVASAGFSSKSVTIKSDNTGVVQALWTGKSKHRRQPEVISKIGQLTKRHGVQLEVQWIPTKKNLADRPSRGDFPDAALRFPTAMELPEHLQPFLFDAV